MKFKFEKISVENGLSQTMVYSIMQDREGYMWFGTQDGLNKYDGYKIQIFKSNPDNIHSLRNNYIRVVYEDKSGSIWIGSLNGYLARFEKKFLQFSAYEFEDSADVPKCDLISSISEDEEGSMWIGTFKGGIKKVDFSKNVIKHYIKEDSADNSIVSNNISFLKFDSSGYLWLGSWDQGLCCMNPKDENFEHSTILSEADMQNMRIYCFHELANGDLLIGTNYGIYAYCRDKRKIINSENYSFAKLGSIKDSVTSIIEDKDSNIWIGTRNTGLYKCSVCGDLKNFVSDKAHNDTLSSNHILTLYNDRSNVMWIGTVGGGVSKINCEIKKFFSISSITDDSNEIFLNNVLTIHRDSKNLFWVGTYNEGVYNFSKDSSGFKLVQLPDFHYISRKNCLVNKILEDKSGNIWFIIFDGKLVKVDIRNYSNEIYEDNLSSDLVSFCITPKTIWLLSLEKGVHRLELDSGTFHETKTGDRKTDKLLTEKFFVILQIENRNTVLIGSENFGLVEYNYKSGDLKIHSHDAGNEETISDNFVISICETEGSFWIGTYRGGLCRFDIVKQRFSRIPAVSNVHDNIKAILADDSSNLWLSTNIGIIRFNSLTGSVKMFDVTDGLQSNEFNDGASFKDKDGTMYFGGINGITYFHPSEIKDNPYIPNVVITDFQIFNKSVQASPENPYLRMNISYASEITLTHKESVFSFEFAALIYNNSQKNQYAYKMEGFDKDWIYCGTRRQATYTNLDPGEYVFKVKGANNDGIWNETGRDVKITISPPYYKTWWFKTLGALALVAATGVSYKQRLSKIEKEKKEQEDFSRKLISSQETERKRIASELHDTIAHDILLSRNKASLALKHKDDAKKMEEALKEISELASATINDVRTISYNLHPHQLEKLGLTRTIKSIIYEADKSTNIDFSGDVDDVNDLLSKESEINLFRVIQEAISNIIKHSKAKKAIVKAKLIDDSLFVIVSDDGIGFTTQTKGQTEFSKGIGLTGIAERIKFMGEYKIESEVGKGTTLKIKIPIIRNERRKE